MKFPLVWRKIVGHSMLPVLPPGTDIIGYRWFRGLKNDQIVIVRIDGKDKVKRLTQAQGEQLKVSDDHLIGDAPEPNIISRSDVIGVVIWPRPKKN